MGVERHKPTQFNVCPWDLLMVIAKAGCIENWRQLKVKGRLAFEGDRVIWEMKAWVPSCFSEMISASTSTILKTM